MTTITTNISATRAQNALRSQSNLMKASMQKLASGKQVDSGKGDSAGIGMVARMQSSARVNSQSVRNANDAISMLQTMSSAGENIARIVGRMGELFIAAETDTLTQADRESLNVEGFSLLSEWSRIATNTLWNGTALMATNQIDGAALNIGLGGTGQSITLALKDWRPQSNDAIGAEGPGTSVNGSGATVGGGPATAFWSLVLNRPNTAGTANTIATDNLLIQADRGRWGLKTAISLTGMVEELTRMGGYINRLQTAVDSLTSEVMATRGAQSKIEDTQYASETTKLSKMQILQQAGTAILAQANQSQQTVLALLQ
jgi:flagellin